MADDPFFDLPQRSFPVLIEFFAADGDLVHTIEVTGPGVVKIPALSAEHGPVTTRLTTADGKVGHA